jgi:hypothetical protein
VLGERKRERRVIRNDTPEVCIMYRVYSGCARGLVVRGAGESWVQTRTSILGIEHDTDAHFISG